MSHFAPRQSGLFCARVRGEVICTVRLRAVCCVLAVYRLWDGISMVESERALLSKKYLLSCDVIRVYRYRSCSRRREGLGSIHPPWTDSRAAMEALPAVPYVVHRIPRNSLPKMII